jgi:hypothetical protein
MITRAVEIFGESAAPFHSPCRWVKVSIRLSG